MCANYQPVTRADRLLAFFGVVREGDAPPVDIYPLQAAPFIRLAEDGSGLMRCDDGFFGLLPAHAAEIAYGRKTYNARSETVAVKPSFRDAWRKGQRCIIPAECIFEANWESGRAVRWAIQFPAQVPMGIAGLYSRWRAPDGRRLFSFAMLTVNADGHPVYQRLHRPGEEKRMVVILEPRDWGEWLACPVPQAARFFKQYHGTLEAYEAPRPPRAPSASSVRTAKAAPPPSLLDGLD